MPTPVPELIALELISRLEDITVANGFSFNVAGVDRVNRDSSEWTPKNNSIVVVQSLEARDSESDHPGNPAAIAYQLTFNIKGFVRQSDRATTADQSKENDMLAAVRLAVAGTTTWHQFDGNSYDADWGEVTRFESESGSHAGLNIELIVRYRVSEINPYTVRA